MSVTPTQIPVSTSVPALTLAAGTTGGLAAAVSIDPVNDYSMIYTASATATQGINRNTYLGISSQPLGKTDTQTGISNKTFVAPVLGAATATSINGLAITSSTGTLTIANGKTLTASNTLTLAGTDSTTMTFPSSSDTVVTLAATQTLTNKTLTSPAIGTSILDTNANTLLALTATASAVNYLTYKNNSTTNPPTITATGSDTNINVALTAKGTGFIQGTPPVWQYLGYAQITGGTFSTPNTYATYVTGLAVGVVIPTGVTKVKVTAFAPGVYGSSSGNPVITMSIWSGASAPAHPIGTIPVFNNAGTIEAVSVANPLPVTGGGGGTQYQELATTTPATGTLALGRYVSSLPTLTTGQMNEPMLDSSSRLFVNVANSSLAVTGTFYQTTQPVSLATNTPTLQSGSTTAVTQGTAANLNATAQITDGTNTANVLSADSGYNGLATVAGTKTITFSSSGTGAQTIGPWNCEGYSSLEIVYTTVGSGFALTGGQFSTANGGTYYNAAIFAATNGAPTGNLGVASGTIYRAAIMGNYFQIAVSALTSGTVNGTLTLRHTPLSPSALNSTIINNSSSTTGTITTSSSAITTASLTGYGSFAEISLHGTYAGITFGITVSDDGGTTFYNVPIYDGLAQKWLAPGTSITPATNANGIWWVPNFSSTSEIKVLASAYTSGTGNVRIQAAPGNNPGNAMATIWDAAGNSRGANVDGNNNLNVSLAGTGAMPALASGTNTIGGVNIVTSTSGGCSIATATALAGTATAVKTTAGQVYGAFIYNPNTTVAYVQFYNTTTGNTTVGTSALNPLAIPPGASASLDFPSQGVAFSTAITIACCTTATGSTGVSTGCVVNIYYA